ncbi:MAG: hypothetical protein IV100_31575 [Myxococcales bacterium]|nr:hypothetical protein [Myxococcales bacterium]
MGDKDVLLRILACGAIAGCAGATDAANSVDSTDALAVDGTTDLTTADASAVGYDVSLIPRTVPDVTPLPGTNCPPDALCDLPVWPNNVNWAAMVSLGCVTGTVTEVGPTEWFVGPISNKWGVDAVALCRGQTFGFQPDGAIAIDWIERSWAAGWFDVKASTVTSAIWTNCNLGYVDPNGDLVEIPDQPPLQQDDLRTAPPGLEPGEKSLLCYGYAALARPGDAGYTTAAGVATLIPFGEGGVKQGDGTTLSTADAVTAIEAGYDKAAKDYANTPEPR